MISNRELPPDLLRTFIAVVESGGINRAAVQLHKTQSAVSMQMQRLEERIGVALFRVEGRQKLLTNAGETMMIYARRLLNLQSEAFKAMEGTVFEGRLRIGVSNAMADGSFIGELAGFARQYPKIQLDVSCHNSKYLGEAFNRNEFDYVIYLQTTKEQTNVLRTQPVCWHAHPEFTWDRNEPIVIASFEPPCMFRSLSTAALREAGIPWQETLTTNSFSALMATVESGLAITARTPHAARGKSITLGTDSGLPPLPEITLAFQYQQASPLAGLLAEWISSRPPYAN